MVQKALVFCVLACLVFFSLKEWEKQKQSPLLPPAPKTITQPIRIVGSEVVFPYAAAVGERFAAENHQPIPILESVGTGGGIALFSRNAGDHTPDILMASRRLTKEDYLHCKKVGIPEEDLMEVPIGHDGLIFVQSKTGAPLSLRLQEIFKALSASTHAIPQKWKDVSSALPPISIRILGPSAVSGTYESLVSLILKPFCPKGSQISCSQIRHDKGYSEIGSNQNMLIEILTHNPTYVGIVTFGFFMTHRNHLESIPIEGIKPTFQALFKGTYPLLRPLYLYIRKSRIHQKPQILSYLKTFFKPDAIDSSGYLVIKGLVPFSPQEQETLLQRLNF